MEVLVDKNAVLDMPVAFGKDLKGLQTLPLCVFSRHWMVWFLWVFFFFLLRMARRCLDVCVDTVTRVHVAIVVSSSPRYLVIFVVSFMLLCSNLFAISPTARVHVVMQITCGLFPLSWADEVISSCDDVIFKQT